MQLDCYPCPNQTRYYEIEAIQIPIVYNRYGWHDPQGRFFVLKSELERHGGLDAYIQKVECQKIRVEPLVIRANAGDCIEVRLTNLLPERLQGSPFQMETITDIAVLCSGKCKYDCKQKGAENSSLLFIYIISIILLSWLQSFHSCLWLLRQVPVTGILPLNCYVSFLNFLLMVFLFFVYYKLIGYILQNLIGLFLCNKGIISLA